MARRELTNEVYKERQGDRLIRVESNPRRAMDIRIVKRPNGEAPEEVRDAWIGLLLPVLPRYSRMIERRSVGVRARPRTWLGMWFKSLSRPRKRGYPDDTTAAIDLLASVNASAAAWWRTNTPDLFKPGRCLFFDDECCTVENHPET
jgi:hypothetical protein